jgi:hypothetical protein
MTLLIAGLLLVAIGLQLEARWARMQIRELLENVIKEREAIPRALEQRGIRLGDGRALLRGRMKARAEAHATRTQVE